jgi:hypothetical protein
MSRFTVVCLSPTFFCAARTQIEESSSSSFFKERRIGNANMLPAARALNQSASVAEIATQPLGALGTMEFELRWARATIGHGQPINRRFVRRQQSLEAGAHWSVPATDGLEEGGPFHGRLLHCLREQRSLTFRGRWQGRLVHLLLRPHFCRTSCDLWRTYFFPGNLHPWVEG